MFNLKHRVKKKVKTYSKINDKTEISFSFPFNLLNCKINVSCNFILFTDKKEFEKTIENTPSLNDCYSVFKNKKLSFINLNFILFYKDINVEKYSYNIQHELNHIFQQIKANSPYTKNQYLNRQYAFAVENIGNSDEKLKSIANIVYLSLPYEQDSFVNELYREIENDVEKNKMIENYKNSKTYKRLKILINSFNFVQDNIEKCQESISLINKKYNTNFNLFQLLKNGKEGIERFKTKIGHIFSRIMNNNMMYESFICDGVWKNLYKII